MKIKKLIGSLSECLWAALTLAAIAVSIGCIDSVKEAVIDSVRVCVYNIMPSLFAACVITTAAQRLGTLEAPLRGLKTDSAVVLAMILGNLGGYPIGARLLKELLDGGRLSKRDAEAALAFCFSPGPAFCFGVIGGCVFKNPAMGGIPYFSITAANFILFLFLKRSFQSHGGKGDDSGKKASFSEVMTSSVLSSASAMLAICSQIVFFSVLTGILKRLLPGIESLPLIEPVLEISRLCELSFSGIPSVLEVTSLLAMGGLCVWMQIAGIASGSFPIRLFIASRPVIMLLASAISMLLYPLFAGLAPSVSVFSRSLSVHKNAGIPILCIAGMVFISISYTKGRKKSRQDIPMPAR